MALTRWSVGAAALLLGAYCVHAQDVPGGWKVIKDRQGKCQFAVPTDWVPDQFSKSFLNSPDGKASAVASPASAGKSFAEATAMAKQLMVPTKTVEDSGKRLWYVYEDSGPSNGKTNWYVAVPSNPVCGMQITFKGAAMEDTAKKIALSLTQAK
jgi:hypothetical protein